MDKNERAPWITAWDWDNHLSIMFWRLKDKEHYETIPLTFDHFQDTRLVTISNEDNTYVISKMQDYVDNHEDLSIYKIAHAGLEMISNAYPSLRLDQQDKG